jgi:hypothetical protein
VGQGWAEGQGHLWPPLGVDLLRIAGLSIALQRPKLEAGNLLVG